MNVVNKSKTYVLPLLCQWININNKNRGFITNTYMFTNRDLRIGKFYIKCKFNYRNKDFTKNESVFTDNELYLRSYSVGEEVLYEYKIPAEYEDDISNFIAGKYSKLSDDYKLMIIEYWTEMLGHVPGFIINNIKKIKQIFDKSEDLRKKLEKELDVKIEPGSELKDPIDINSETFQFKDEKKVTLENIYKIF